MIAGRIIACIFVFVCQSVDVGADEPYSFEISGACSYNSEINDEYAPVNTTSDSRWYYQGQLYGLYVYFDPDCDGPNGSVSSQDTWLIDSDKPSSTATSDLDGDEACLNSGDGFKARINNPGTEPPSGTRTWRVWCGPIDEIVSTDLDVVLIGAPSSSPTRDCLDSDNGALDPYGEGCADYEDASWCGKFDDADFSSNRMCCFCGGGSTTPTSTPTVSPPPSSTPFPTGTEGCFGDCGGFNCDHWVTINPATYTCVLLETYYSCDCTGCTCPGETSSPSAIPTVSSPPSATPSPTEIQDVCTFLQLQIAVAVSGAIVGVISAQINFASQLSINWNDVRISGTSGALGQGAVLDGGGLSMFEVVNGGRLVLESLELTNGFDANGAGAVWVGGVGSELILYSCTLTSNTAEVRMILYPCTTFATPPCPALP